MPRRKAQKGKGLLDLLKKGVGFIKNNFGRIKDFAKENRLISRGLGGLANLTGSDRIQGISDITHMAGYGRKRRRTRRTRGRGQQGGAVVRF